jgi:hypothetical protein
LSSYPHIHFCVFDHWNHQIWKPCEKCWAAKLDTLTDGIQLVENCQWLIYLFASSGLWDSSTGLFKNCSSVSLEGWVLSCWVGRSSGVSHRTLGRGWRGMFCAGWTVYSARGNGSIDLILLNSPVDKEPLHWKSFLGGSLAVFMAWSAQLPRSPFEKVFCATSREIRITSSLRSDVWPLWVAVISLGSFQWKSRRRSIDLRNGTSILCRACRAWLKV